MNIHRLTLLINTVKYLQVRQIYYRIRNTAIKALFRKGLVSVAANKKFSEMRLFDSYISEIDYEYSSDNNYADIKHGVMVFLNRKETVDWQTIWHDQALPQLWRYNVHYFDYLRTICREYIDNDDNAEPYQVFKKIITAWVDNNIDYCGDGWHQYTVSLRIVNWIGAAYVFREDIYDDNEFGNLLATSIYRQYYYLKILVEKDVLGNHYLENIKALILCSVVFSENETVEKALRSLKRQVSEQILSDGMHFEYSPMYQKIVFEDILRIADWLKKLKRQVPCEILECIAKMADCIYSFERNLDRTPLFNDSADGIAKNSASLLAVALKKFSVVPRFVCEFSASGYYVLEHGMRKIIFDAGKLCPDYLPAHAHCDALSFEMYYCGKPVISNSGTYSYSDVFWRGYFRSTAAHNTVKINSCEQAECWSNFRVARRIKKIRRGSFDFGKIRVFFGEYCDYCGNYHRRCLLSISEELIVVLDYGDAISCKTMHSFLHFDPSVSIKKSEPGCFSGVTNNQEFCVRLINIDAVEHFRGGAEFGWYSREFGKIETRSTLKLLKTFSAGEKALIGYCISHEVTPSPVLIEDKVLRLKIQEQELTIDLDELEKLCGEHICV